MDSRFPGRMITGLTVAVACWAVMILVRMQAEYGPYILFLFGASAFLLCWVIAAGERWWLTMPAAVSFGGIFYFGFKIFLYELALAVCLLSFWSALMLDRAGKAEGRRVLPASFWVLVVLFAVEWSCSFVAQKSAGAGGVGSMTRSYFLGFWPLVFLLLFSKFGVSRLVGTAMGVMYVFCLLRVLVTLAAWSAEDLVFLPYVNFVFSGSYGGLADFRFVGILLLLLSLGFSRVCESSLARRLHVLMAFISGGLILLGGGRVTVAMLLIIPVIWAAYAHRVKAVVVFVAVVAGCVVMLNKQPEVIYRFPPTVQRGLSILVHGSRNGAVEWHEKERGSNEWHRRLMEIGFEKWAESPWTLLLGHRVKTFDDDFLGMNASLETRAKVAANLGLYESGLWTVLGMTGVVGLGAYACLFFVLLRKPALLLWREGMRETSHIVMFVAVTQCILWAVFSWIAGSLPSQELMLAGMAWAAAEDRQRSTEADPEVSRHDTVERR